VAIFGLDYFQIISGDFSGYLFQKKKESGTLNLCEENNKDEWAIKCKGKSIDWELFEKR
jgi:hypothetical protein